MSSELEPTSAEVVQTSRDRRWRARVPREHRATVDTRLAWLWNQRSGTVQAVWADSPDMLDKTAATIILQALFGKDLASIALLFRRLEGGPVDDTVLADDDLVL